jgi:cbb3-type cytochrome oxidase cytochrome c subunit
MKVMQTLGVPYTDAEVTNAKKSNTITISKKLKIICMLILTL